MHPDSVHLTAFKTPFGLFQYNVVPFGLSNAPAQFSSWMRSIFHDLIGKSVFIYLDDILIFSETRESHTSALKEVFSRLVEHKLLVNLAKC